MREGREREKDAYVQSERMCGRVRERKRREKERKRKEKETQRGTTEDRDREKVGRKGGREARNNKMPTFKTMNPFLSFVSLSSHIVHLKS